MSTTTNLSTLKINYLTQAQYETALANNQINEDELYFTPDSGIDTAGTGLSKSGTTLNHTNSVTAQTTQAVYPITYDAQGHITGSGTAVTIPTVPTNISAFTNDAGYLTNYTETATLSTSSWSNNTQTITVTGVTASNTVIITPAPASTADYVDAGCLCVEQGEDTLTFTCEQTPSSDLVINVLVFN